VGVKILLDENISKEIQEILLEMGYNVYNVKEIIGRKAGSNSISDTEILNYASDNKHIIVTKDNGMKLRCLKNSIPFVDLGSPKKEAEIIDRKLKEMQSWKEYL